MDEETRGFINHANMQTFIQQQEIKKRSQIEDPNIGKWELDTNPFLDRLKNELLGNTEDEFGNWVRDYTLPRVMNSKGVNALINEISARINIHMQFSDLNEQKIIEIASEVSENFGYQLIDEKDSWEIFPQSESNYSSISMKLYDILYILLLTAKDGGMKKHREKSKNPYLSVQQGQEQKQNSAVM
jgi:hypothetical protein